MADNITLNTNATSGAVVKTDDDGTAHWQYVKVAYGADNTQTLVTAANGLTVQPDSGGFAVSATLDAETTKVIGTVNISAAQTIAAVTDITNTVTVDGTGTFAVQAAQSGTWTVDLGANNDVTIEGGAVLGTTGSAGPANAVAVGGTEAGGTFRELAVDSSGNLQVDIVADGAGLLTTAAHDAAFGTAGTADAQVRSVQGIASMTPLLVDATGQGDVPITLAGEAVVLGAGSAAIGKLTANSGVDIGDVDVTSISAGSNLIGDVGISGARTSGGTTIFRSIDVDETEDEVKAAAGQVYWIHAMNLSASMLYLKVYNAAAAAVTVGTTTPVLTFPIATQGDTNGAGFTISIPNGIAFSTGICVAATTGIADNDTGAPGANACVVNLGYA